MALVKFLRGLDAKYSYNLTPQSTDHENAIYFATDKGYLYLNGTRYGGDDAVKVKDVVITDTVITIQYTNGTTKDINILNILPEAVASDAGEGGSKGLLSANDKEFIDQLNTERKAGMSFLSADQAQIIAGVGQYENKVESVSGNILSLDGKNISATVSLSYDENSKSIKLVGKDGADLGTVDATPFIKDGMISNAELATDPEGKESGKYLVLTWNTDAGESEPTYIPLTELVDVYTAGNAISISADNEVAVVVAASTEAETNYLVNDGGLKVSEMGADVTVIKEAIPIAGGPLAGYFDDVYTDEIPANTSIESLLFSLVCQEKWPNPAATASYGSLTSTLSAPSSTQS